LTHEQVATPGVRATPGAVTLPSLARVKTSYLICTLPRSGSWLLAEGLRATGVAGRPEEYFWPAMRPLYLTDWGLPESTSPLEFLDRVIDEGTTENGVFGAKVHSVQLADMIKVLRDATGSDLPVAALVKAVFPGLRLVWHERVDRVGQALSWYRALATDNWWHVEGEADVRPDGDLDLDVATVARLERRLATDAATWRRLVAQIGAPSVETTYEQLVDDFEGTIRTVLAELQVRAPAKLDRPRLARQADAVTEGWRVRYEASLGASSARARAAPPPVSIVIVSHNEAEHLQRTVDAFLATTPPGAELVVVDDGSTDGGASFLEGGYRGVRLARPERRMGVAGARNHGAALAAGDVLVFSDAHVQPHPGWLGPLIELLSDLEVGEVAPTVSSMEDPGNRGFGFTWRDASLSTAWLRSRPGGPSEVPFVCGCFLAMRRSVFEAAGGFDDGALTWGSEDAELSLRLWRMGFRCVVVPDSEVGHLFRRSFAYEVPWEETLHNTLRVGAVHFGARALEVLIDHWRGHAAFPDAYTRLLESDVWSRREQVAESARHGDRWFFEHFEIEAFA
jgi:LPS sulfotransferase NodH/glycosyltransferase involved in cell wall biosynthesis